MSLGDSYKTNLETIQAAAENKDLCLLEVYDRITGEPAVMLCAGYTDEKDEANIVPLAQMCAFNPLEKFVVDSEDIAKYRGHGTATAYRLKDGGFDHVGVGDAPPSYVDKAFLCAWGILRDHLEDTSRERLKALTPRFVEEVLSQLSEEWSMSARELDSWIHHAEHPEEEEDKDGQAPTPASTPTSRT